jgi:hypothetical protein
MTEQSSCGAVCVCKFADGEVTRMTTFSPGGKLNLPRGIKLACYAYESRMKCKPPTIIEASFELHGKTVKTYTREQLKKVAS